MVQRCKEEIVEADAELVDVREELKNNRAAYDAAAEQRKEASQSINRMLHRKPSWTSPEVLEFTELCQQEHTLERNEAEIKLQFGASEQKLEACYGRYMNALREHYHQEQIWSEKGRRLSNYATWSLIIVNSLLFVLSIAVVEPHKRKRMVENVTNEILTLHEAKTKELLDEYRESIREDFLLLVSDSPEEETNGKRLSTQPFTSKLLQVPTLAGSGLTHGQLLGLGSFAAVTLLTLASLR